MSLTYISGDIEVIGFEFAPGVGGRSDLPPTLWWGTCADGDVLVGRLILARPVAVEPPVAPQTWGRMKALCR
jgi:hypothetical protein